MQNDNFNPQEAIKTLDDKTSKIVDDLDSTDKFSARIINAINKNKDLDSALKKLLLNIVKDSDEFKNQVRSFTKNQINSQEFKKTLNENISHYLKNDMRATLKTWGGKIAFAVWSICLIFVSSYFNLSNEKMYQKSQENIVMKGNLKK